MIIQKIVSKIASRQVLFTLILIMILGAILRLYDLPSTPPALFPDEAVNGINTLQVLQENGLKVFYKENFGREGLFMNIQAISVYFFGTESWALRLPSAIFGILTIWSVFLLTRELLKLRERQEEVFIYETRPLYQNINIGALVAAFFVATSFWHLNFSRIGFRAIMAPFFATLGSFLILKSARLKNNGEKFFWHAILGGFIFGVGMNSYLAFRALPILIGLYGIYELWQAKINMRLKDYVIWAGAISIGFVIAVAPLTLYFINNPEDLFGRTGDISIFKSETPIRDLGLNTLKTLGMFHIAGDFNDRHNLSGMRELSWPVGILAIIGFAYCIKSLRKFNIASAFLIIWFLVALLPVVLSKEGLPHALRAILVLPSIYIISAFGFISLYDWIKNKITFSNKINTERALKMIKTFGYVFAFGIILETSINYFIIWANNPNTQDAFDYEATEFAYNLRAMPNELKKYVYIPSGDMGINVVQFLTNSYTIENQNAKNIYYIREDEKEYYEKMKSVYVNSLRQ